jgi:hypothetical protein
VVAEKDAAARLSLVQKIAAEKVIMVEERYQHGWFEAAAADLKPLITERNHCQEMLDTVKTDKERQAWRCHMKKAQSALKSRVQKAKRAWVKERVDKLNTAGALDDAIHGNGGRPVDPGESWRIIRELGEGMGQTKPLTPMILKKPDGSMAATPEESSVVMQDYLAENFTRDGEWSAEAVSKIRQRVLRPELANAPTDDEIRAHTNKLKMNRAAGDSKIPAELFKPLLEDARTFGVLKEVVHTWWKSGSFPGDVEPGEAVSKAQRKEVLAVAESKGWRISFIPENNRNRETGPWKRYEAYKSAETVAEARALGATMADLLDGLDAEKKGGVHLNLHGPTDPAAVDVDGAEYAAWLVARVKLLPKKGDLSAPKNWRSICLVEVGSKIVSSIMSARVQVVQEAEGLEAQSGFRWRRGTTDGLFALNQALRKRKEHGLETYVLFLDLIKAFDTVPRDCLWAILRKFGIPDHLINLLMRLHTEAVMKFKVGDTDAAVENRIGVRQGSTEGPNLFLFVIQAGLETMEWPVPVPQFCTRENGVLTGERSNRVNGRTLFELLALLFADDCAALFETKDDLIAGTKYIYPHLKLFGLHMHVGEGATLSKTEAMFFPGPGRRYEDGDTTRFFVDDTGRFIDFAQVFKYLGGMMHYSLESDTDVDKRVKAATAAFGALSESIFRNKHVNLDVKGRVYTALVLSILLYGSECWCLREDLFRRLQAFHNRCARTMCRITMAHTIRNHIRTADVLARLGIKPFTYYYHNRLLRWGGHVARMDMDRLPRMFLTAWVNHSRPVGCPQMTWGRTFYKALAARGIPRAFAEWSDLAQDRDNWADLTRPNNNNP